MVAIPSRFIYKAIALIRESDRALFSIDIGFSITIRHWMGYSEPMGDGPTWIRSERIGSDQYLAIPFDNPAPDLLYGYGALCSRVIDGDTIVVNLDIGFSITLVEERIRLAGLNTPELSERSGLLALDWMRSRAEGKNLILQTVRSKDLGLKREKYGRFLADVWCDEHHLNSALISEGHAAPFMVRKKP